MTLHDQQQSPDEAIRTAVTALKNITNFPEQEAEELLCLASGLSKESLYLADQKLSESAIARFQAMVQERSTGKPLAYITGTKGFYGREFIVTPNTLIPRPETEVLIEETIRVAKTLTTPSILDIGTGGGCIAITLALEIPGARVIGTDIDPTTLAVAKQNAARHSANVEFFEKNLLNDMHQSFSIIVANLPYVPDSDKSLKRTKATIGLDFEPEQALYAGNDGLSLYRKFLPAALNFNPQFIIIEHDPRQTHALNTLAQDLFPSASIYTRKDLAGHDRILCITTNNNT